MFNWLSRRKTRVPYEMATRMEMKALRKRAAEIGVLHGVVPLPRGGYRVILYGAEDIQVFDDDELLVVLRGVVRGAEAFHSILRRM